jgi:hypothetical protein
MTRREPRLRIARRPLRRAERGSDLWFAPIGIAAGIALLWVAAIVAPLVERAP